MSKQIERGLRIKTAEDTIGIKGYSEQQFALFLLRGMARNPDLEIEYEPVMFEHVTQKGKTEGTLPDFYVNPGREKSKGTYIEITVASKDKTIASPNNGESSHEIPHQIGTRESKNPNGNIGNHNGNGSYSEYSDPKERQKRIMSEVAPSERYVVLYRQNLEKIQKAVGGINFFNGKNHTDEEKKEEGI